MDSKKDNPKTPLNQVEEPFTKYGKYSYADYLTWEIDEMVELIRGKVYKMAAAPTRKHQKISLVVSGIFITYLRVSLAKLIRLPSMSACLYIQKRMKTSTPWSSQTSA